MYYAGRKITQWDFQNKGKSGWTGNVLFASQHCLISNREGLGMGLANIDPHSQTEHTEIHKIPKFGVNYVSFD